MATKQRRLQNLIRRYRDEKGKTEVTMREVAEWAAGKGFPLPEPKNPIDLFAKELSKAAREETRKDTKTNQPYRVNHAYKIKQGEEQLTLWVDIDNASRNIMKKCVFQRREQMVGEAVQLSLDLRHWNDANPNEKPLTVPLDFEDDVEWRLNVPDEDEKVS